MVARTFVLVILVLAILAVVVCVLPKIMVIDPLCEGLGIDNPFDGIVRLFQELVALPIRAAMWLTGMEG